MTLRGNVTGNGRIAGARSKEASVLSVEYKSDSAPIYIEIKVDQIVLKIVVYDETDRKSL